MIEGIAVAALVVGFPAGLFAFVLLLDRFESAFVQPDERAAALVDLVRSSREPEEVEHAAAEMLATVVASRPAHSDRG
jgi:hypothetical protein